jgi:hypothetical protein
MDDALTPEERRALFLMTDARIKALQIKALKRLAMTDEEKALFSAGGAEPGESEKDQAAKE